MNAIYYIKYIIYIKYKFLGVGNFTLQIFLSRCNQVKILDTHMVSQKKKMGNNSIIREHAMLDFPARILLGNFEKLLLRPLFVGITMLNGLSTRCAMYSVNENIVLPTAHTVTRAHAVSLSHTISTTSRCNDAAVPAFCEGHASYIFRAGWKSSYYP